MPQLLASLKLQMFMIIIEALLMVVPIRATPRSGGQYACGPRDNANVIPPGSTNRHEAPNQFW